MKRIIFLALVSLETISFCQASGIRISLQKCDEYRKLFPSKPEKFSRNNKNAELKQFSFMARITNVDAHNYYNGILISENYVLSVADADRSVRKQISLGNVNVVHSDAVDGSASTFEVVQEFTHPKFKADSSYDLALLKLNGSIQINEYIRPACLPQPDSYITQQVWQIGWSHTDDLNSYEVQKLKVNLISNAECQEKIVKGGYETRAKGLETEMNLCAVSNVNDPNVCGGIEGAALLNDHLETTTLNEIVGIASANVGCDKRYPNIIVRLSRHIDWIESIVWPRDIKSNDTHFHKFIEYTDNESTEIATEEALMTIDFTFLMFVLSFLVLLCFGILRSQGHKKSENVSLLLNATSNDSSI